MIRHIVVATDFSTRSDRALRRATMLAKRSGAILTQVHVVDDDQPAHLVRPKVEAARAVLEESARTIEAFDKIPAYAMVVTGDVYSGIVEAADDLGADIIVVGSHRRQFRDLFVGTTAQRVIAHSGRPVLMAAGVPSAPYDRALVALGLDDDSASVAKRTHEMRALGASQIVAIHAYDAPARGMLARAMSGTGEIDDYLQDEGLRASGALSRLLGDTGLPAARHRAVPLNGTAARTIKDIASDEDASLIIVGTSRKKGIERLILGSAAEEIVGSSDRDVLVIPA